MNLASPFSLSLVVITALAFLGLPIGLSMICGSIFYLLLSGADMGIVAEQFLNGMYSNYVILAVPLFIPCRGTDRFQFHTHMITDIIM